MRVYLNVYLTAVICIVLTSSAIGQKLSELNLNSDEQKKFIFSYNERVDEASKKISHQTDKKLARVRKLELKLLMKYYLVDSIKAKEFRNLSKEYLALINQNTDFKSALNNTGMYIPYFDSIGIAAKFIQKYNNFNAKDSLLKQSVNNLVKNIDAIQNKLKASKNINELFKQRSEYLEQFFKNSKFTKYLNKLNKERFYYSQAINEYKTIISEPGKAELFVLNKLKKVPGFNNFMEENSFLASLFPAKTGYNSTTIPDIPGLQTRKMIEKIIPVQKIEQEGGGGKDLQTQSLTILTDEFKTIKSKIKLFNNDAEMPSFKPNTMRSKSLLKKIEIGANFQFNRSNNFIPGSMNVALQVAYKFHQNGSFGFGTVYLLGINTREKISITGSGVGFRSFVDYKAKKSFFINGGFEYNYVPLTTLNNTQINKWQKSALLGISKKYRINAKLKGNVLVLYDFLHKQNFPQTQPFVFRFGYNL